MHTYNNHCCKELAWRVSLIPETPSKICILNHNEILLNLFPQATTVNKFINTKEKYDLIISNNAFANTNKPVDLLEKVNFSLMNEGTFLFATIGSNSDFDTDQYIYAYDMHDVGDLLLKNKFKNPVMDCEYLEIETGTIEIIYGCATSTNSSKIPATLVT